MSNAGLYYYFVEGECEYALVKALMHSDTEFDFSLKPGRVKVFNVVTERLTKLKVMEIKKGTKIVFVFDTDVKNTEIFEENIELICKFKDYSDIIFVPSVKTFEDEIIYCCDKIKKIHDLLGTKGTEEFKKKFIDHKDIVNKLTNKGFDFEKLWSRNAPSPFNIYQNNASQIKNKLTHK